MIDLVEQDKNRELLQILPLNYRLPTKVARAGRSYGLPNVNDLMFIVDMGSWTRLSVIQNLWQWTVLDRVYAMAKRTEIRFGCKIWLRVELPPNTDPLRRFTYHGTLILELAKRLLTNYASMIIEMEAIGHSVREMYGESTKGVYKYVPEVYDPSRMYLVEEIIRSFVNPCFKEKVMAKAKAVVAQTPIEGEPVASPVTGATPSDAPPRRAPRQAFRVDHFIYVQEPADGKLATQAKIILEHIKNAGADGIGKQALVDALTRDTRFVTRQPVERVLTYYQRPLIDANLVVSKQVTPAAAPESQSGLPLGAPEVVTNTEEVAAAA